MAVIIIVPATVILKHLHHHHLPHPVFSARFVLFNEVFLLLPALGATAAMAFLEDAPYLGYGLAGPAKWRDFCVGFIVGLVGLSLLVAALIATGYGTPSAGGFGLAANLRFGLEWLLVSFVIGFTEEVLFRGYLFATLSRGAGPLWATLITSLIFASAHGHNAGETLIGLVLTFEAALLFCYTIHVTRSLWLAIGLHAAWDYAENYIFGTRDSGTACYGTLLKLAPHGNVYLSGGLTGPEGSLFALVMVPLMGLALFARYRAV